MTKNNYTDRIKTKDNTIMSYLSDLKDHKYQIPTFQREVVWGKENTKKLWDSIYKFYPLGSILIWKTDTKLHNHREIGGHLLLPNDFNAKEYQYILDGQQRTTSLLTSIYGGQIDGKKDFDPTLYVDLTIRSTDELDDGSYKHRFLYWSEIDDKEGTLRKNTARRKKFDEGLIVKLLDIKTDYESVQEKVFEHPSTENNFKHPHMRELAKIQRILDNYQLSFIELQGIEVSEVCQIFERINQAGKPLEIFDIVVAKTYRSEDDLKGGFYLREIIDSFREESFELGNKSNFLDISNFDYLQIIAILIKENIYESGISNITDRYLNDIKTEQIEEIWEPAKKAILKVFDFFENRLHVKKPQLLPYRYFYLTLASYFFKNENPNYEFIKQYFWHTSFHNDDLLSNTTDIKNHIAFLINQREGHKPEFQRFLIDRDKLRNATYSSKGRYSRAILSLFASKQPKDWKETDRYVHAENLFFKSDKPNLHHVFPLNYINNNKGENELNEDSLMNIAYLTQLTNLNISDKNPLGYISNLMENPDFFNVIYSHMIPPDLIKWAEMAEMPTNALDLFIERRIDLIVNELRNLLQDITFEIIDTKAIKDDINNLKIAKN